jgi:hypothetical protein
VKAVSRDRAKEQNAAVVGLIVIPKLSLKRYYQDQNSIDFIINPNAYFFLFIIEGRFSIIYR